MLPFRLVIPKPCDADWTTMTGSESKRFCESCRKSVHNISMMTQKQARVLIEQKDICVRYAHTSDGSVRFQPSGLDRVALEPTYNLTGSNGVRALVAASAFASSLLAACAWIQGAPRVELTEPPMMTISTIDPAAQVQKPVAQLSTPFTIVAKPVVHVAIPTDSIELELVHSSGSDVSHYPSELELQEQRAIEQLRVTID